jgi:hypothetical protein
LIAALFIGTASLYARASNDMNYVDGHWTFNVGGGFTPTVGGINNVLTDGWNFAMGTGFDFNEKVGLTFEFMSNHLGLENSVLNNYSARLGGIPTDGDLHMWSLTLNPTWRFGIRRGVGGYLIGGGGYYHVNAQVTTPGVAYMPPYCDPWWGCWGGGVVSADKIVAEHKDDTGGVNFGGGITFNLGPNGTKLYVESRYHYVLTHGRTISLLPLTVGFKF